MESNLKLGLTPSEQRVASLLIQGYGNGYIAKKLGVKPASIPHKLCMILKKCKFKNRIEFIVDYYKNMVAARDERISFMEDANLNLLSNYRSLAEKYNKLVSPTGYIGLERTLPLGLVNKQAMEE